MKFKKVFLVCAASLLLASCGSASETAKPGNLKTGSSVLTQEFLKANVTKLLEKEGKGSYVINNATVSKQVEIDSTNVVNTNSELMVYFTKNTNEKIDMKSLITGETLVNDLEPESYDCKAVVTTGVPAPIGKLVVTVDENKKVIIFDALGNVLFNQSFTSENYVKYAPTFTAGKVRGFEHDIYLKVRINKVNAISYFEYAKDGSCKSIERPISVEGLDDVLNSLGVTNLEEYGHKNHYLKVSSGYEFTTYEVKESGEVKSLASYKITDNSTWALGIVGDHILFQQRNVTSDAHDYDVYYLNKAYKISTFTYNYMNGSINTVDFPVFINECQAGLFDDKGITKYAEISGFRIYNDATVSTQEEYFVIDESFNVRDNTSRTPIANFVKTENGDYFSTESIGGTYIFYDKEFNEIIETPTNFRLDGAYTNYILGHAYDSKTGDSFYGAFDYTGKVVLPFKYSNVEVGVSGFVATYDDNDYFVKDGTEVAVSSKLDNVLVTTGDVVVGTKENADETIIPEDIYYYKADGTLWGSFINTATTSYSLLPGYNEIKVNGQNILTAQVKVTGDENKIVVVNLLETNISVKTFTI